MDASTPFAVRRMELNKKEEDHKSRVRLGFHVYLSRFFTILINLSLKSNTNIFFTMVVIDWESSTVLQATMSQ